MARREGGGGAWAGLRERMGSSASASRQYDDSRDSHAGERVFERKETLASVKRDLTSSRLQYLGPPILWGKAEGRREKILLSE